MGLFSGLIDSFTGKSAKQAVAQARGNITGGYERASPYYAEATTVADPFYKQGIEANTAYQNALGINGPQAAGAAFENYSANPGFLGAMRLGLRDINRKYNARGLNLSGANMEAEANTGLRYYDDYLNRLAGQGQQGLNAAGLKTNALTGRGNFEYGYGRDLASNDIARGQANSILGNNVLGLGGALLGSVNVLGNLGWKPFGSGGSSGGGR